MPGGRPVVAVVGGGIAGLAAAWELTGGGGPGGRRPGLPAVVLLEASPRLGGKLATEDFCGGQVEVGPDGFLGRRPEAAALCREVGLGDDLVPVGASGAAVWARGRRRPLPEGLVLGVPTKLLPAARSGILSVGGTLRLASDLVAPRPDTRGPLGDRAIGPLVARKLGHQVVERLVDPLVGGIHAGAVADASAAAVFPALLTVSQGRASFMRSLRRLGGDEPGPDAAPLFWALRGGFGSLVESTARQLADRQVDVRLSEPVEAMARRGARWELRSGAGTQIVDGVVVATAAGPAAALLAPHDAEAAAILRALDYASVAVVTMAYPEDAFDDDLFGTGLLVPHGTPLPREVADGAGLTRREPFLVTACTYLWAKWPHLGRPGVRLLRASAGRAGDARHRSMPDGDLARRVAQELRVLVGVTRDPLETLVTRWDDALPQYRVHHLLRVAGVEAAVRRLGALAVAGAAYRGVGIPACIESGRAAAADVLGQLSAPRDAATA
ncbi:MAG TPA: protoporphyrinogen oxidase [Acidimicrobiales bacterium]|nr:protoporphyrinogen oxidase [Acidimicrobiales bacterium]